jgi:hypothetical protein
LLAEALEPGHERRRLKPFRIKQVPYFMHGVTHIMTIANVAKHRKPTDRACRIEEIHIMSSAVTKTPYLRFLGNPWKASPWTAQLRLIA